MVRISTANAGLDGSGTVGTVITGASNGTLIQTVIIKASGAHVTRGMVRLFINNGSSTTNLLQEVEIPTIYPSGIDHSFETTINLNYNLKSGYRLYASTENAETFDVTAIGLDYAY